MCVCIHTHTQQMMHMLCVPRLSDGTEWRCSVTTQQWGMTNNTQTRETMLHATLSKTGQEMEMFWHVEPTAQSTDTLQTPVVKSHPDCFSHVRTKTCHYAHPLFHTRRRARSVDPLSVALPSRGDSFVLHRSTHAHSLWVTTCTYTKWWIFINSWNHRITSSSPIRGTHTERDRHLNNTFTICSVLEGAFHSLTRKYAL